jgi:hypothetical protein
MLIKTVELPYEISKIVEGLYKGRLVKLEQCIEFTAGTNWHDANIMRFTMYNQQTGEMKTITSGWYENYLSFTKEELALYHGQVKGTIEPHIWIIETNTYPKSCTIHTHPANVLPLIEIPADDLSNLELKFLYITRSLISSARLEEARRFGIPKSVWEELKHSLIQKGYVMKNGALTLTGKNRAANLNFNYWEV